MKILWTQTAAQDAEHIYDYIAQDSPLYAAQFIERLINSTEQLLQFPESGRYVPEAEDHSLRELLYQGYRIVYQSSNQTIHIVMIVHGSRRMSDLSDK